ncbi:cytochrome P450 [Nocardioides mangrovicus]|uniref:Cytochrome P450 n=1 Tax=Nocardioides mangrovicus TaxID=2478913 RepID=A0A3L8NX81_9ACTN|nr:cytochrome P450 [Nocardioides mangrovicus]RLV47866.1 cytochrome P450 [Nocardioides mangrovicus]
MSVTEDRLQRMRPRPRRGPAIDVAALPPGPRSHAIVQSIGLLGFRHRFVPAMRRRYGDAFTLDVLPEGRHLVVFERPEVLKEIFAGDPEVFHAGKGNAILGPVMGEHSLLLVDGATHQRARKLLMPAFNGHALRGYADVVTGLAKTEVGSWTPGRPFRSLDRMNALTLEVILQVVFGVTDEHRLAELRPLVNQTVNISPLVFLGWGLSGLHRYGPWRRTYENQQELDRVIYAEIAERRRAPDLAERGDVLSRLLLVEDEGERLGDDELRDQLVTLLLAGHETTATALSWSLYELGRDPGHLARAREAALGGDDDHLEAVLKEAMRLHPVIPMVVRHLMAPARVGGYDLPAGVTVAASILLAHSDPRNFPLPLVFDPSRFEHGRIPPNTWLPFGGGVRRCIGAGFSLMEGVAVLREVLTTWDLEAVGDDEPKVRNITSVPRHGARIAVAPR